MLLQALKAPAMDEWAILTDHGSVMCLGNANPTEVDVRAYADLYDGRGVAAWLVRFKTGVQLLSSRRITEQDGDLTDVFEEWAISYERSNPGM